MRQKKKKEKKEERVARYRRGAGSLSRSRVRHGGSNPFLGRSGSANEFPRNVSRIEKGVAVDFFRDFFFLWDRSPCTRGLNGCSGFIWVFFFGARYFFFWRRRRVGVATSTFVLNSSRSPWEFLLLLFFFLCIHIYFFFIIRFCTEQCSNGV